MGAPAHAGISAGSKQDQQAEILDEVRVVAKLRVPSESLTRLREVLSQKRKEVPQDFPNRAKGSFPKGASGKRKRVPQDTPTQHCMPVQKHPSTLPGSVRLQQYLARGDIPPQMGEPTLSASIAAVSSIVTSSLQEVVPIMVPATRGRDDFLEQRFSLLTTAIARTDNAEHLNQYIDKGITRAQGIEVKSGACVTLSSGTKRPASKPLFPDNGKRDMAVCDLGQASAVTPVIALCDPSLSRAASSAAYPVQCKRRPVFCYPTATSRQAKQARVGAGIHAGYEQLPGEGGLSRSSGSGEDGASLTTHMDAVFPPKLSRGPC
jgi:hypothetical protein